MSTITTNDGVDIFYKDWGDGQPIVFSHGWPPSADDWDTQMLFFLEHGYCVIAHDRRGHGRSSQTGDGHDMDHYADDLAALTAHLDLKEAVHVGHSTGGGEVVHYLARHGESRVSRAVLISAVSEPPAMLRREGPSSTPTSDEVSLVGARGFGPTEPTSSPGFRTGHGQSEGEGRSVTRAQRAPGLCVCSAP